MAPKKKQKSDKRRLKSFPEKEEYLSILEDLNKILKEISPKKSRKLIVLDEYIEKYEALYRDIIATAQTLGVVRDVLEVLIEGLRGQVDFLRLLTLAKKAESQGELRFMLNQANNAGIYAYQAFEKVSKKMDETLTQANKLFSLLEEASESLISPIKHGKEKWHENIEKLEELVEKMTPKIPNNKPKKKS